MAAIQFTNHYPAELDSDLLATDAQLVLKSGHGDEFPAIANGEDKYFYVTLINNAGTKEIIKIIQRASGSDTLIAGTSMAHQPGGNVAGRAQEGTTALAITAADDHLVELRLTAGIMQNVADRLTAAEADINTAEADIDALEASRANKVSGATVNNLAKLTATGDLADAAIAAANVAVKVSGATLDNLAKLTADGGLADSGVATANARDATKLQGRNIISSAPSQNQVLRWDAGGSQWADGCWALRYTFDTLYTVSPWPTTWTDIDLSSFLGTGAYLVHIEVRNGATAVSLAVRRNGQTAAESYNGVCGAAVAANEIVHFLCVTDGDGVIQIKASVAGSGGSLVSWFRQRLY